MLINPSRECCAYADMGPQGRLEIRRVGGKLEPVLCSTAGERPITSHNLPKLKSANHFVEAISKLAIGYVRVAQSSGEWHLTYQNQCQSRGFSPLVISSQEADRQGRDLSGNNNPVESRLDVENKSHSSSISDGSSAVFVEEGGAPGENIPAFENGNFEPNSPRSTISVDRVSLLSSKELPYLASAVALVVDGGAAAQESGSSISSQTAEMITAIVKAAIEPYAKHLDATLDEKLRAVKEEISANMSEGFVNSEDRVRRERAQERDADKKEAREERAEERAADKEETKRLLQQELDNVQETLLRQAEANEESKIELKKTLDGLVLALGELPRTEEGYISREQEIQLAKEVEVLKKSLRDVGGRLDAQAKESLRLFQALTKMQEAIASKSSDKILQALPIVLMALNFLPSSATGIFRQPGILNFLGSAFKSITKN